MNTSVIRDLIGQFNANGIKPTCRQIADVLAKRTNQPIGTADLQDKLDDMENAGMIVCQSGDYSINSNSPLNT